jgi:hypothetical protein
MVLRFSITKKFVFAFLVLSMIPLYVLGITTLHSLRVLGQRAIDLRQFCRLLISYRFSSKGCGRMDKLTIGLVLTIVGMGGTLLSLWFITLVVQIMKKFFPYREVEEKDGKEVV